jgi:hypothetical protein
MIIHCTKKLATKLPNVSRKPLTEHSPLGSWHAHFYTIDRRNCLMFCHDKTRFTLFMAGLKKPDFERLEHWFLDYFANTLLQLGYNHELIMKATGLVDGLRIKGMKASECLFPDRAMREFLLAI